MSVFFTEDVDFYRHRGEMLLNSKMLKVFFRLSGEGNDNHRSGSGDEDTDGNNLGGESVLGGNAQPEGDLSFG